LKARENKYLTPAGLVTAADEQPPLLRVGGAELRSLGAVSVLGQHGLIEDVLEVTNGEDGHLLLASLGLGGRSVIDLVGGGNVRAHLVEEVLELGLVLPEGVLLLGSDAEEWQGEQRQRGEPHDDGWLDALGGWEPEDGGRRIRTEKNLLRVRILR